MTDYIPDLIARLWRAAVLRPGRQALLNEAAKALQAEYIRAQGYQEVLLTASRERSEAAQLSHQYRNECERLEAEVERLKELLGETSNRSQKPTSCYIDEAGAVVHVTACDCYGPRTTTQLIDNRDPNCVKQWPGCGSGEYDPRCCRFPKSCSAGGWDRLRQNLG